MRRLPPMCPSCHVTIADPPDENRTGQQPRVCRKCGHPLNEAELERQSDELAAALFEGLEE